MTALARGPFAPNPDLGYNPTMRCARAPFSAERRPPAIRAASPVDEEQRRGTISVGLLLTRIPVSGTCSGTVEFPSLRLPNRRPLHRAPGVLAPAERRRMYDAAAPVTFADDLEKAALPAST